MALPNEFGFELGGVNFGIYEDISVDDEGFDPGSDEWEVQDGIDPRTGHTSFGRDRLTGPTWAWTLHTNMATPEEALAVRAAHKAAWRADHIRDVPGAMTHLRYTLAGRTRRIYGRPRRWASPPSNRMLTGLIPITCDFKCVDALHYDDLADSVIVDLPSESAGGFTLPAVMPIQTIGPGEREGFINVGGDAKTYPVIRVDGPINNAWVTGLDWRLDLNTNIAEGQWIEIDTHPWVSTVKLFPGGANRSGVLGRRQWLSKIRLTPGQQEIRFGGASTLGTAKVTVTWRSAWTDL